MRRLFLALATGVFVATFVVLTLIVVKDESIFGLNVSYLALRSARAVMILYVFFQIGYYLSIIVKKRLTLL